MTTPELTNRATTISLRLAPSEFAELKRMADAAGATVSAFVRSRLFESDEAATTPPSVAIQRTQWQASSYGQDARLASPVGSTFSSSFGDTRGVVSFNLTGLANLQGIVR